MSTYIDLSGKRYGRWLVLSKTPSQGQMSNWRCQCDCGTIKDHVLYTSLTAGRSQSCGCLRRELLSKPDDKVHTQRNPTYRIWMSMKTRCLRSNHPSFQLYGARGITITDERWLTFANFLADMGNRPEGTSLDRIDNEKGYCKENCRWSDVLTQNRNRRNTIKVEWKGQSLVLVQVARMENIDYSMLRYRLRKGGELGLIVSALKEEGKVFHERALILGGCNEPKTTKKRKVKEGKKKTPKPYQHPSMDIPQEERRVVKPVQSEYAPPQKVRKVAKAKNGARNAWLRRCMAECEKKGLTYRGPLPTT